MYADLISKSSSFLFSIYSFIYSINFWSYSLPNSNVLNSNNYFAVCYFYYLSFFTPFFAWWWSFVYSTFYSFFYFLPVAIINATGGFFSIYAVSLCLLSNSPVNGHESHLPVITLFTTIICIYGNLHLGQHIYFYINLSKHFNIYPSVN